MDHKTDTPSEELTDAEIRRQDLVDNAVHELIRRINPSGKEIELDTNIITNLREAVQYCFPTGEQTFYPYLKDEAEIAHVPSLPGGTLLGLEPYHTKEFALVLTVHRDDLVEAGLPKGLAEKVSDDTLVEIGDKLGEALVESGYWDCLRSLISSCGYGEDDMVERLVEDGWTEYEFYSRGAGVPDIRRRYLFHPDAGFNAEAWRNKPFFHLIFGDTSPHNKEFAAWLAGIDKKLYIELETSQEDEDDVVERLMEEGWIKYEFYSAGSGVPNIPRRYLFHPDAGLNAEAWVKKPFFLFHLETGDTDPHNEEFAAWLAGIDKKLYIEIETSQDGEEDKDDV